MERTKYRRCKRHIPLTRTKAELVAAWERPFNESLSRCFSGRPLSEQTAYSSAVGRRATIGTLRSRFSRMVRRSRRTTALETKVDERALKGRISGNNILPSRYTVCIKPNLVNFKFDGSVLIQFGGTASWDSQLDLENQESTTVSELILNTLDLNIGKVVWADDTTMKQQEASSIVIESETERLILTFDPPVSLPGVLIINFSGQITETTTGFYRSKYISPSGEEKYGGVTMFQPTFARKCFPCLDEPAFKVKFDLSIIVPKHLIALSNLPIQTITPHRTNKNLHVIEFETTPAMSTYSLGFVVGQFDFIQGYIGSTTDFVNVKIYAPFGEGEKCQYALGWAQAFLKFYQIYFDRTLEMRKLDMVNLTSRVTGGMEHWGIINFQQGRLIQQDESDSEEAIEIVLAVSHAIANQWIGNLVTMEWWNALWLKEGLTTFLKFMSTDYFEPDFKIWHLFLSNVVVKALEADSLHTTHALDNDVHYPSEINEIFDEISIGKGAAIIRMIQQFVGEKTFQHGVQAYLKRFAYRSASSTDFLQMLEDVSGKPVTTVFEGWIKHSGFPLIKIESSQFELNGHCRVVILHQERYSLESILGTQKARHSKHQWIIPIQLSLSSSPSQPVKEFVMDRPTQKFKIMDTTLDDWFMLNPGFTGFYRVKYPPDLMGNFLQAIRTKLLSPEDRLGLLNDLHALALAGISSTTELLTMLESFSEEEDFLVWKEINIVIGSLDLVLQNADCYPKFKSFARGLFRKIYEKLGWTPKIGESSADSKLRVLVLRRLLKFGHTMCIQDGFKMFRQWLTGGTVDLPEIAFQSGILDKDNNDEVFRTLLRHFRDSNSSKEKLDIVQSFGFAESEEVIMSILDFTASEVINCEETVIVLDTLMQNSVAKPLAWQFFMDNVTVFQKRFPTGSVLEVRLIEVVTQYLGADTQLEEVATFFHLHQFLGTEKVVQDGLDKIKLYSAWLRRDKPRAAEYLSPYEE